MSAPQHHVEAARLCVQASELLSQAAELLSDDYDDRRKEILIQSLADAADALTDWLVP